MNTTFDILVIVLSTLLGIFLIITIIAVVMILKLISALRKIVAKGENLVESVEEIGDTLKRNAGAVGLVRTLMKFMNTINKVRKD